MGLFTKDIRSMDDLFVHGLRDIYYAEQQIAKALPKMAGKASDPQLASALRQHLDETERQIEKVEQVFRLHGVDAKGVRCQAIEGIIGEGEHDVGDIADEEVRDAAILAAAQAVEHYEIARYGTLAAWAEQLGRADCAAILEEILAEEKATDAKLTRLAEAKVNQRAI